jgi:hypothetical protein
MRRLRAFFVRVCGLAHDKRQDQEFAEELQTHLQMHTEDNIRLGMTPDQARREAILKLGGIEQTKQVCRDQRALPLLESFVYDLRFALRGLRKSPGFTIVAVATLALGIGANSAIFTLIDQVLLRKLPVREPQQLVAFGDSIFGGIAGGIDLGGFGGYFPWDFARQLEENPGPFQGIAAYGSFSNNVSVGPAAASPGETSPVATASLVSGNYFTVLGAQALLGRTILPADDATPGSGGVVVVSYHFWQQSLSSDPAIIAKSITINGAPFEVVGIMPEEFHGFKQELETTDLWTPISMQPVVLQQQASMLVPQSGLYFLHIFGRLSPQAAIE